MTSHSSSTEPLSSDSEDLRQRSTAGDKTACGELKTSTVDLDGDNEELVDSSVHTQTHKKLLDHQQMCESKKVDRSTIQLSILFYTCLFATSKFSSSSSFWSKFYTLSYKYPGLDSYDIGPDDLYFTIFWIISLLFLRSFLIIYCFKPCAKLLGIKKFKATQRFIEQMWSMFYYSFSWGFGFYLYYTSDYFFDCRNIYANWPHDKLSGPFKFYYLVQTASWFQQSIVIFLEAKRKDHLQMVSHHVITLLLCTGSYCYYFTRIGHIVLLLMDIVDVLLSTAKILKYCGFQTLCDLMFIVFMVSWIILRHGVYIYVLWFSWKEARNIMDADCSKFALTDHVKLCYTDLQIDIFLLLLAFLQVIMCIWMYMILRVAFRVIRGGSADDVRSDSDED